MAAGLFMDGLASCCSNPPVATTAGSWAVFAARRTSGASEFEAIDFLTVALRLGCAASAGRAATKSSERMVEASRLLRLPRSIRTSRVCGLGFVLSSYRSSPVVLLSRF